MATGSLVAMTNQIGAAVQLATAAAQATGTFQTALATLQAGMVTAARTANGVTALTNAAGATLVVFAASSGSGGITPTFSVGTVAQGASASVTLTGSAANPVLNFVLPQGVTPTLSIGTVSSGTAAAASLSGTAGSYALNLVLPQSAASGTSTGSLVQPTFAVGTVTSGSRAAVTLSGTQSAGTFNFTLVPGATGSVGPAPVLSVGSVTSGSTPSVSIAGANGSYALSFVLQPGAAGGGGGIAGTSVGSYTVGATYGGPERTLARVASDRFTLAMFGATASSTTVAQALGVTTRAQIAAWTNSAGNTPYAFAASQPWTQSDDTWTRALVATAAGATTLNLGLSVTLANAGYFGPDGNFYLPVPQAGQVCEHGLLVTGAGLPAGTRVILTQGSTIRVTTPPQGFTIASGATITIQPDMTQFSVGKQVWSTQGIAPLTAITAVSGTTITLSRALVSTSLPNSQGGTSNGVQAMAPLCVYTPLAESSLAANITMDTLALIAGLYGTPAGGTLWADYGSYVLMPGAIVAGTNVSIEGSGGAYFGCIGNASPVRIFPCLGSTARIRNLNCHAYNGIFPAYFEIDGGGYFGTGPTQKPFDINQNNGCEIHVDGISSDSYGGGATTAPVAGQTVGPYAQMRLRNLGNVTYDNSSHEGWNTDVPGNCAVDLANVVLFNSRKASAGYAWSVACQTGYCEDPICRDWNTDHTRHAYDQGTASTYNGYTSLLFKFSGGDCDCSYETLNLRSVLEMNVSDVEVTLDPHNGDADAGTAFATLAGCQQGTILGIEGGTAVDYGPTCLHLTSTVVDGASVACSNIRICDVAVSGFASAVTLDPGTQDCYVDAILWDDGQPFGIAANSVVDNSGTGSNLVINQAALRASAALAAAMNNAFYLGNIPAGTALTPTSSVVVCSDAANGGGNYNDANGTYTIPASGVYRMSATCTLYATGAAGACTAGTAIGIGVGTGTAVAGDSDFVTTAQTTTLSFFNAVYYNAGQQIALSLYAASTTHASGGTLLIERIA